MDAKYAGRSLTSSAELRLTSWGSPAATRGSDACPGGARASADAQTTSTSQDRVPRATTRHPRVRRPHPEARQGWRATPRGGSVRCGRALLGPYPGDDLLVLLAPHGARAEEQVPDEADHQRDRNTEVGVGPLTLAAAQAERLEQEAQPVQTLAGSGGVDDQAPADDGGRDEQQ